MNLTDRLFVLRSTAAFAQLRDAELVLIAGAARPRRYEPGELVGAAGRPLKHLFLICSGSVTTPSGEELPKAFGAESLLFGSPVAEAIRAGSGGATCLLIRRAHFHTIVNECPGLVVGLLQGPDTPAMEAV